MSQIIYEAEKGRRAVKLWFLGKAPLFPPRTQRAMVTSFRHAYNWLCQQSVTNVGGTLGTLAYWQTIGYCQILGKEEYCL